MLYPPWHLHSDIGVAKLRYQISSNCQILKYQTYVAVPTDTVCE